jgi:hypothetical protein
MTRRGAVGEIIRVRHRTWASETGLGLEIFAVAEVVVFALAAFLI